MLTNSSSTDCSEADRTSTRVGRGRAARRTAVVAVAALGLSVAASACTPQQMALVAIHQDFGSVAGIATQIAQCESGMNPAAVSPGGAYVGLFQISTQHAGWIKADLGYNWSQMTDPVVNARVAKVLYDRAGGFSPWHGACGGRLGI